MQEYNINGKIYHFKAVSVAKKREREEVDIVKEKEEAQQEREKEDTGKIIPLRNKKGTIIAESIVSTSDYEQLKNVKHHKSPGGYASSATFGKLHIHIVKNLMKLDIPKGYVVDHVQGEGPLKRLDNRRSNLRVVKRGQNPQNLQKKRKTNTTTPQSKYHNVCFDKRSQKWKAGLKVGKQVFNLGQFFEEIDAARAFDCFVWHNREKFNLIHTLNFPDADYSQQIPFTKHTKKSPYNGVFFDSRCSKFIVSFRHNGKKYCLGRYKDEVDAARAHDACVVENNLSRKLNFPSEHPDFNIERVIQTRKIDHDANGIECILQSDAVHVNDSNITIDISDYDKVKHHAVSVLSGRPCITVDGNLYSLSRYLMDEKDPDVYIEHFPDHNPMNCTRKNLVKGDVKSNAQYKQPQKGKQFVGVRHYREKQLYQGFVHCDRKSIFSSKCFKTEIHAARARDLFLLSRPDLRYRFNFNDWKEPGVLEEWTNTIKSL